jgi:hypothetical protein
VEKIVGQRQSEIWLPSSTPEMSRVIKEIARERIGEAMVKRLTPQAMKRTGLNWHIRKGTRPETYINLGGWRTYRMVLEYVDKNNDKIVKREVGEERFEEIRDQGRAQAELEVQLTPKE